MSVRYLYGPSTAEFATRKLYRQRQAGQCLVFDPAGSTDLAIGPTDTWESVQARLPAGWQPDAIVLQLSYTTVPEWLWSAPVPLVAVAHDWTLLWHGYRRRLRGCELILTDSLGVETLAEEGIAHARAANFLGREASFLEAPWPAGPRDIDILFVGNVHPAVQRERLPWLGRLAHLGDRYRIAIYTGIFGDGRNISAGMAGPTRRCSVSRSSTIIGRARGRSRGGSSPKSRSTAEAAIAVLW